jgi:membrane fusion protein (multidrug efflux system)
MSEGAVPPPPRPLPFRRLGIGLAVAVIGAAIVVTILFVRDRRRLQSEAARRHDDVGRGPRVFVAPIRLQPGARDLLLPADVRGFFQSTLYAKVPGYVKSMAVDKGDAVRKDQLIGILESPEVDQQVAAAEADVLIKRRTYERYQKLVVRDFVSAQDFEITRSQYGVSLATLRQMRALQAYKELRAPFAGTVTGRYVDPGALIPAATGATSSAMPVVDVAELRRLRITLFVHQDAAPFIQVGDPVTIRIDERPDLKIEAHVSLLSKALDPRSRTMWCEIWIDNDYRLYPGTFVHVLLHLKAPTRPVVPSAAVLLHDNQTAVAVIRRSRVRFIPVRTDLDNGKVVQIVGDIQPDEKVALNLPAEIADGQLVQAVEQGESSSGTEQGSHGDGVRARSAPPTRPSQDPSEEGESPKTKSQGPAKKKR